MRGRWYKARHGWVGAALLVIGCGSGGSLDSGWMGLPWKSRTAVPQFADTANTTALASAATDSATSTATDKPARSERRKSSGASRPASGRPPRDDTATSPTSPPPPAVASNRLQATLLRLRELERRHHRLTGSYSGHPTRLGLASDPGVELRVVWASPWGWAALARDSVRSLPACAIYVGTVPSALSADGRVGSARPGAPVCADSGELPPRMLNQVLALAHDPPSADQALLGLMRADLMNLAVSQRQYRSVQGTYSRTTRVLPVHYSWSSGVSLRILAADSKGWAGEATYDQLPGKSCVIYAGTVAEPPATAAEGKSPDREGVVVCDA